MIRRIWDNLKGIALVCVVVYSLFFAAAGIALAIIRLGGSAFIGATAGGIVMLLGVAVIAAFLERP